MGKTQRNDEGDDDARQLGAQPADDLAVGADSTGGRRVRRVRFGEPEAPTLNVEQVRRLRDEFLMATQELARVQARQMRALADLQELVLASECVSQETSVRLRSLAAECAVPAHISDRAVLNLMGSAHALCFLFPQSFAALERAEISMTHVRVIVEEAAALDVEQRSVYEAKCVDEAARTTPARLRARARALAEELLPRSVDDRHELAAAARSVWVREMPDGMAELGAILPAVLAYAAKDRIDKIAKAVKVRVTRDAHERVQAEASLETGGTVDSAAEGKESVESAARQVARAEAQRLNDAETIWSLNTFRADAFAEILLTGVPAPVPPRTGDHTLTGDQTFVRDHTLTGAVAAGVQAAISIIIPVGGTATLEGYGPIDTDTARRFAAVAPGWDHTIVELDGTVVATERRQPTEGMKRILRGRDEHCRFLGCFVPVTSCEIDHTIEWAQGGKTEMANLANLCPKHHLLKHPDLSDEVRWRVQQDAGGVLVWLSPAGAEYVDEPERVYRTKSAVTVVPSGASGPAPPEWSEEQAFGPGFETPKRDPNSEA